MTRELLLSFLKIIGLTFCAIILIPFTLSVIYLLKRIWQKHRYKFVWTPISSVERRSNLSDEEFVQEYASVGKPVIITDIVKNWKASTKWTLDFFRSEYGSSKVIVGNHKNKTAMRMSLANYIDYMTADGGEKSFYLEHFRPYLYPELYEEYTIPVYFTDWLQRLPINLRGKYRLDLHLIYIGAPGTSIGLHYDLFGTSALVALISGRKKVVLFTPDQQELLYEGKVDIFKPDLEKFPLYARAKPVEAILEPGELIYIPSMWWHQVTNIETSISLNCNIINEWNSETVFQEATKFAPQHGPLLPLILEFPWLSSIFSATGLI